MARIGIFPGVFDPVHEGHIAFSQAAVTARDLDSVIFIPEATPWHKTNASALEHRLAMLSLALAHRDNLEVRTLTSQRFTVAAMLAELKGWYPKDSIYLLVGSDVVRHSLFHWQDYETLLTTMPLIVGLRAADTEQTLRHYFDDTPLTQITYITTNAPYSHSTAIRDNTKVHPQPQLADYIRKNKLYL